MPLEKERDALHWHEGKLAGLDAAIKIIVYTEKMLTCSLRSKWRSIQKRQESGKSFYSSLLYRVN
jgi:hypothetical protein